MTLRHSAAAAAAAFGGGGAQTMLLLAPNHRRHFSQQQQQQWHLQQQQQSPNGGEEEEEENELLSRHSMALFPSNDDEFHQMDRSHSSSSAVISSLFNSSPAPVSSSAPMAFSSSAPSSSLSLFASTSPDTLPTAAAFEQLLVNGTTLISSTFLSSSLSSSSPSSSFSSSPSPSALNLYNYSTTLPSQVGILDDDDELVQQYYQNRALDSFSLTCLGIVYTVLIFIGAIGNGLVCLAVARQPKMRTSRNLFIINLAISDLLLCFFTIPFSLVEISTKSWPYGIAMCKLVLALEATSIFVSTLSITAIALDRYQVILHSMNPVDQSHRSSFPHIAKLLVIWMIGTLLALPLFLFRTVEVHNIGIKEIDPIKYCIEKWPITHGRFYYSVFSMLIQYFVPITIVSVVYTRLCIKLRSRTMRRTSTTQLPNLRNRLQRRARRTNMLLISIALIFCISWLPLNALNVICDLKFPFENDSTFRITFAVCHMAGMSSSCSNPFLYGWLNQNFRNEFEQIFGGLRRIFLRVCLNKKVPVVLQRGLSDRTNGPQQDGHQGRGGGGGFATTTMSPNHELMPFPMKNHHHHHHHHNNITECTAITDLRSCAAYCTDDPHHHHPHHHQHDQQQHSVLINFEPRSKKSGMTEKNGRINGKGKEKKNKNKGGHLLTADPVTNETRTTQLYLDTNFGVEGDCTSSAFYQCRMDSPPVPEEALVPVHHQHHQPQHQHHHQQHYKPNERGTGQQQRNSHTVASRFKRLALTDSRKRKRKKSSGNGNCSGGRKGGAEVIIENDQCPSVSAIATDHSSNSTGSIVGLSMDRNNNTNSGNDQNGIVLAGTGTGTGSHKAAQLAVSSTAAELKGHADHKRNDLTEALLPRR